MSEKLCQSPFPPVDESGGKAVLREVICNGRTFITDHYAMVRADLLAGIQTAGVIDKAQSFAVPISRPPLSGQPLGPRRGYVLHRCGVTVHEGGELKPQPLYRGDELVGYLMPQNPCAFMYDAKFSIHARDLAALSKVIGWIEEEGDEDADLYLIAAAVVNGLRRDGLPADFEEAS